MSHKRHKQTIQLIFGCYELINTGKIVRIG